MIRVNAPMIGSHRPTLPEAITAQIVIQMNASANAHSVTPSSGTRNSSIVATARIVSEPPSHNGLVAQ
jgi:hypothetical protein